MSHPSEIHLEAYVYTSLTTEGGSGYHWAVREGDLLQDAGAERRLTDLMQILRKDVTGAGALAYAVIGDRGVLIRAMPISEDWAGRQGACASVLAFRLDELMSTTTGSPLALDLQSLRFVSHDDAAKWVSHRESAPVRSAHRVAVLRDRLLMVDDAEWVRHNAGTVASALELRVSGVGLELPASEDSLRLMRWWALFTAPPERIYRTFVLNAPEGMNFPAEIVVRAEGATAMQVCDAPPRRFLASGVRPKTASGSRMEEFLRRIELDTSAIEAGWTSFIARLGGGVPPYAELLPRFIQQSATMEVEASPDSGADLDPRTVAAALVEWARGGTEVLWERVRLRLDRWMRKPAWFVQVQDIVAEEDTARRTVQSVMVRFLVSGPDVQRLPDSVRAARGHAGMSDWIVETVIPLLPQSPHLLTAELLRAVGDLPDGPARTRWTQALSPLFRRAVVRGGLPVRGQGVRFLREILRVPPAEIMSWLSVWPSSDPDGQAVWAEAAVEVRLGLSIDDCRRLVDWIGMRVVIDRERIHAILHTMVTKAEPQDWAIVSKAVRFGAQALRLTERQVWQGLADGMSPGSTLQRRIQQQIRVPREPARTMPGTTFRIAFRDPKKIAWGAVSIAGAFFIMALMVWGVENLLRQQGGDRKPEASTTDTRSLGRQQPTQPAATQAEDRVDSPGQKNVAAPVDGKHTVTKGESLSAIADRYPWISVDQIRSANNLHGDMIRPGQVLRIPRASGPTAAEVKPAATAAVGATTSRTDNGSVPGEPRQVPEAASTNGAAGFREVTNAVLVSSTNIMTATAGVRDPGGVGRPPAKEGGTGAVAQASSLSPRLTATNPITKGVGLLPMTNGQAPHAADHTLGDVPMPAAPGGVPPNPRGGATSPVPRSPVSPVDAKPSVPTNPAVGRAAGTKQGRR